MSWIKDTGYFERTPDMVFALQRQTAGKRTKQVPVIRYESGETQHTELIEIDGISVMTQSQFAPISIDNFLKAHKKNNPTADMKSYRAKLERSVQAKKSGALCAQCGCPIWAIGTATVGWSGCFTCITGETDSSEDYEIDSVCF
jgi:hypothetical protein